MAKTILWLAGLSVFFTLLFFSPPPAPKSGPHPQNNFPTVFLKLQAADTIFDAGDTATLEALPDDCDGTISYVDIYKAPNQKIAQLTQFPFLWNQALEDTGVQKFWAIAVDDLGDTGVSNFVGIYVTGLGTELPEDSNRVLVKTWNNPVSDSAFPNIADAISYLETWSWTDSVSVHLLDSSYSEIQALELTQQRIATNKHHLHFTGAFLPSSLSKRYEKGYSKITVLGAAQTILRVDLDNVIIDSVLFSGKPQGSAKPTLVEWAAGRCNFAMRFCGFSQGEYGIKGEGGNKGGFFLNSESTDLTGPTFSLGDASNLANLHPTDFEARSKSDYDTREITIDGLLSYDSQLGAPVPYSTSAHHGGGQFKIVHSLTVKNWDLTTADAPITVEHSRNISINALRVREFGKENFSARGVEIDDCDSATVANSYVAANNPSKSHTLFYFEASKDLNFFQNTASLFGNADRALWMNEVERVKVFGNILPSITRGALLEFLQVDSANWESDYNIFVGSSQYHVPLELSNHPHDSSVVNEIQVTNLGGANKPPVELEYPTYQLYTGQDESSKFLYPNNAHLSFDSIYLRQTSVGRNFVPAAIGSKDFQTDVAGFLRKYPTDAGASDGDATESATPASYSYQDYFCKSCQLPSYLPQPSPQVNVTNVISKSDIHSVLDVLRSHELNERGEPLDVPSMIDTSDVVFGTNGAAKGVTELDPLYGWEVQFAAMKQSWKNPVNGIIEWRYPVRLDSMALWIGSNEDDTGAWVRFFGSNDLIEWKPLSDKLNWSFTRKFLTLNSQDTGKFRYFKAERGTRDVNGYGQSSRANVMIKIVAFGEKDTSKKFPEYLSYEELPQQEHTFAESMGVNAYYTDSLNYVEEFSNVSQFVNYVWHYTAPGEPFAINPAWVGRYTTIYHDTIRLVGSDGLPNLIVRRGMPEVYKHWKRHGTNFVFQRFQLNSDAELIDTLNNWYNYSGGRGENYLMSQEVLYTDTTFAFPENRRREPQIDLDTFTVAPRNIPAHDYTEMLWKAWDSLYYTPTDTGLSDWITDKEFLRQDTSGNWVPGKFKSIVSAFRMTAEDLAALADPSKRDSVFSSPETYGEWGEFCFNYAAIMGRNPNIPKSDLHILDTSMTEVGLGVVDAMSSENEADKDWKAGLGSYPAIALGMMRSVMYDGHMGLVKDARGGHRIGMHAADSTMILAFESTINSDMQRSIMAQHWCEYFRRRDSSLTNGTHPYTGEPIEVKLENCAWDFHEYRTSGGSQGAGTSAFGYAVGPELHSYTNDMLEGLRAVRSKWPDYPVYCSEYGYGHSPGNRYAADKERIGIVNPTTGQIERDTTYDLLDAQASNNDWDSMFRHRYLDKFFLYQMVDYSQHFAVIDTSTTPFSINRDAEWNASNRLIGFPTHGLRTNVKRYGANAHLATVAKPAWYSMTTLIDVIGNSIQQDYVVDDQDSVAIFKYYDPVGNYITYAVRRFSQSNSTSSNYAIDIPSEAVKITRIEPIRNQPTLHTENLGDLEVYITDVREKYFLLKIEF